MRQKGRIFLLDDDELIVSMLTRTLKKEGYAVHPETGTDDVVNKIREFSPDVVLLDVTLPGRSGIDILREIKSEGVNTQVIMLTADDTAETAVKAIKLGAVDYLTKPFNIDEVKIVINKTLEKEKLQEEVNYLRKAYSGFIEKDIIGESKAIKNLESRIKKIAEARVSTILITGESGTGKELVARHIHFLMYEVDSSVYAPFVSISCAAIPEHLIESELFGYQKGSFTDAKTDKKGLFELASGGSVLLDEIGEMKKDLQSKLLRVLEERKIRRIGGKEEISIDTTIIATTNKNLLEAVEKGEFRKDLFFRLSNFYLHVVPLRERKDDVPLLSSYFLSFFSTRYNKKNIRGFSPEAEKFMISYSWPGNIRELKNLVERFVVLENEEIIDVKHLPKWLTEEGITKGHFRESHAWPSDNRFILPESGISLEDVEKNLIQQALEKANNNKTRAAKLLNISYDTLRYQLKKFGLK